MTAPNLDVVGVGFASIDMVGLAPALPELDRGVSLQDITRQGGGPVAQAMVTVARLGGRAGFVGRTGDDEAGEIIRRELVAEGVETTQIQVAKGARSPECLILVHAPTGKRSMCCFPGTMGSIDIDAVDPAYLARGRILHLDGIDPEAATWAARLGRQNGQTVCLDAGGPSQQLVELVPMVDVLIAAEAFARSVAADESVEDGARRLQRMGPGSVVVTCGDAGAYSLTTTEAFWTPPFSVDVVDTTGAGDVFHGAYLYGMGKGWDDRSKARFAAATAALKCTRLGGRAGIPRLHQVQQFLASSTTQSACMPAGVTQ